jgi:hypothetical protein
VQDARGEHDGEFLAHLAVGRVKDHVPGIGVDADNPGDLAFDAGFLEGFADCGLGDGLPEVDGAAWKSPVPVVCTADQQEIACLIDDSNVHGRHQAARPRCLRIVVVVDPPRGHERSPPTLKSPASLAIPSLNAA